MRTWPLVITLLLTLSATGCLDVDETVDVQASGAARLALTLRTDGRLAALGRGDLAADLRRRAAELDGTPGVRAEVLEEGPGAVSFVLHVDDLRSLDGVQTLPGLTVTRTSRGVRLRRAIGQAGASAPPARSASTSDDGSDALAGLLGRAALSRHGWTCTVRAPRIVGPDGVVRTTVTIRAPLSDLGGEPRVLDVELLLDPAGIPGWVVIVGLLPALLCVGLGAARRAPRLLLRGLALVGICLVVASSLKR
jgi:hypothetical protein